MAKEPKPDAPKLARFRLKSKAFIDGSFIDPADASHKGKPVYVMLPEDSKGAHLEPAPDGYVPRPEPLPSTVPLFSAGPNPVNADQVKPGVAGPALQPLPLLSGTGS